MNHISEALAANFRDHMSSAGYEPSTELIEALANEFDHIAARDMDHDSSTDPDSSAELDNFVNALAYAASRF